MKKLLSIFSLLILTFSNIIPVYTFADSGDNIEQAKEILTNELNNTLNELSNNTDGDFTNNLEQGPETITQNTIDWYQCFGITAGSTEASVTKYNCEYEDIIVPGNIKYLNGGTFSGKIINTIRFENEDTNIIGTAFSGAIISGNVTLPGNQEYNERSVLENIIIGENGTLKINKQVSTNKIKVYGKAIVDFSERNSNYINSYGHFNNSYVDGTIVFTGYNGQVGGPSREILRNSTLTENGKIIFDENITGIYGLCNQSNSECKGEIVLPNNSNIYYSFYQTNYDGLKINNTFNLISNSFTTNPGRSTTISGNIFAKKIENSFGYVTVNGNVIISKDETNSVDETISSSFYEGTISGDIIISGDNLKFGVGNMTNEKIIGDLTITGQNLNISAGKGFNPVHISGDLKIYSNILNVDSTFQSSEIGGSVILKGDENLTLSRNVLSSTKIGNDIILSGNNIDIELYAFGVMGPKGVTIGNNLEIYTSEINTDNSFNDMNISGDIKINGGNINLDKSFKKGKINKGIKIITDDFTGTNNTFEKANINGDFEINGKNIKMTNGFFWSGAVSKDITIKGENITGELSAFANLKVAGNFEAIGNNLNFNRSFLVKNQGSIPEIGKNLLMSGKNIVYYDGSLDGGIKTKNLIIKGDNVEIKNSFNLDSNNITGIIVTNDLIIDVKNLTGDNSFERPKISGNLILSGINMILKNNFMAGDYTKNALIGKDLRITTNKLICTGTNTALYQLNVNGDTIISGDNLEFRYGTLGRSKFNGDLKLYSNNFFTDYGLLYNSEITGDLRLPKNTTLGMHTNYKTSIKNNLILGGAKTIIPTEFAFSGGLIIEDGEESTDNIFKNYKVGNNQATISGTLSTIGEKAYAFKEGTRIINTITLAEDFNTGNIGDDAFCIEGGEPVKGVTKKQYTEEEYQDLLSRACIDLSYNGKHSLLLKIEGKQALVEYDGTNNVVIPETIKKDGYTIEWFEDEDLLTGTNINNQSFEDFEYQKTIYGKYVEIPVTPSAGGGSTITPTKQETKVTEQEHNSADTEDQKVTNTQTNTSTNNTVATEEIKQQVIKVQERSLTRGEIAVMTNILLEVYPQLVEGKQELDDVTNACSNYVDEQNFTKDEKKAITRLCKLSIMGIHNDTNKPLEEFLVNNKSTNDEFSKVINRSIETYNEKDLSIIKDALKKLEGDEENVVFGTVYDVFMSIKSIFN